MALIVLLYIVAGLAAIKTIAHLLHWRTEWHKARQITRLTEEEYKPRPNYPEIRKLEREIYGQPFTQPNITDRTSDENS